MNLYRLIDEATKTVEGYEMTEGGEIYHKKCDTDLSDWGNILSWHSPNGTTIRMRFTNFIPHTRKDMYTGVDVDGVKVFERDNTEHLDSLNRGTVKGIVRLTDGCFEAYIKEWGYGVMVCNLVCNIETSKFKIIGIEGVT